LTTTEPAPARREDLVIQELPGEVLLYDPRNHRAHCLNRPAAAVWRACDGARTVADLRVVATAELGAPLAPEAVDLALRQLSEAGLLRAPLPPAAERLTRRELARRLGAAALVPALLSLTAPDAAAAAASGCRSRGQSCSGTGQGTCCVGLNCLGGICF